MIYGMSRILDCTTECKSTIEFGKQFQMSITRQAKDDVRELINDRGLTNFNL